MRRKYGIGIIVVFLILINFNLIDVFAQLSIKPDELPDPTLGVFYEATLYVQPQMEIDVWEISSGSLPQGLTLSRLNSYTGVISGTPSSLGTYRFTVKAIQYKPKQIIIYREYTINVIGLRIYPEAFQHATENSSYSVTIWVAGGFPPYSWSVTGLSTEQTNLTWRLVSGRTDQITISGTPLIGSHGNYTIEVRVSDSRGVSSSKNYLLNIKEVPWIFSVEIRHLTEEGSSRIPFKSVLYLDDLVFNTPFLLQDRDTNLSYIYRSLFRVTVRRVSGTGNKSVRLDLIALPRETTPLGITMFKTPASGSVGDEPFVSIIAIKVDTRYPYVSEEHDLRLTLRTSVLGTYAVNNTIAITLKGIGADVAFSVKPIQVLQDVEELVVGKSTIFKINVSVTCSREPIYSLIDIKLNIRLTLPFSEWDWELPSFSNRTSGQAEANVTLILWRLTRTSDGKYACNTILYLPRVHSHTYLTRLTGDPFIGRYFTASYPRSVPRPKYVVFGYPPGYTGEVRESGTVSYVVKVSSSIRETNLDNNTVRSVERVMRTKPIRILFYPWAENATEKTNALAGRSEGLFRAEVLHPNARTQVEFLQAIYPTAEGAIRYNMDPTIRLRNGTHDTHAWPFLYGENGLARMAEDAGYDFAIAFRVVGGLGVTWPGSRPMAAYVDGGTADCYACLAHEMYHVLGPMPYDDYSCPVANQCPEGYWVNRDEHINAGRCYLMSACGGAPWWITRQMYEKLMYGWFNPSGGDPMAIRVSGVINRDGTGRLYPFRVRNASRVETPGLAGNYSIVLLDSKGVELSRFGVNATFWGEMYMDMYSFMFYVPFSEDVYTVELRKLGDKVLDRRVRSANRPQVSVLTPKTSEIVSSLRGSFTITWEGRDLDGDALYYTVLISPDGGESWLPIDIDLTTNFITWNSSVYDASENYVVKVIVSDGFYSTENISNPFTIGPYVQLKVESPYGETRGSGWHLVNETATFSIAPTQVKMDGLLGVLGGYYEFAGWSGDSASTSPTSTILMDVDKTVTAVFKPNYAMPIIYLAAILIPLLLVSTLVLRKRRKHAKLSSS